MLQETSVNRVLKNSWQFGSKTANSVVQKVQAKWKDRQKALSMWDIRTSTVQDKEETWAPMETANSSDIELTEVKVDTTSYTTQPAFDLIRAFFLHVYSFVFCFSRSTNNRLTHMQTHLWIIVSDVEFNDHCILIRVVRPSNRSLHLLTTSQCQSGTHSLNYLLDVCQ